MSRAYPDPAYAIQCAYKAHGDYGVTLQKQLMAQKKCGNNVFALAMVSAQIPLYSQLRLPIPDPGAYSITAQQVDRYVQGSNRGGPQSSVGPSGIMRRPWTANWPLNK